jgi:ubiquinol-cytochrome c reductase cytochrome b subunit
MDHLTPLALAIWIMDDGSKDGSGLRISTNCFKKEEIIILLKVLKDKYDLSANIRQQKLQFVIFIPKIEMVKLNKIIEKHIVKSMLYKLGK